MTEKASRLLLIIGICLCGLSLVLQWSVSKQASKEEIALTVEHNLERELKNLNDEAIQLINDSASWKNAHHFFFVLENQQIKYWNQNDFMPDFLLLQDTFDIRLISVQRGNYLLKKYQGSGKRSLIFLLPLVERYKVSNSFLPERWNKSVFPIMDITIYDASFSTGTPVHYQGRILFKISIPNVSIERNVFWEIIFWYSGLLLLFIWLLYKIISFNQKRRYGWSFSLLFFFLAVWRLISIYLHIPLFEFEHPLFSPRVFASSALNSSLADLFLNTIVVCVWCSFLFVTYSKWLNISFIIHLKNFYKYSLATLCLSASLVSFLFPFFYYEMIFHNSSISLDITHSIHFDLVRVVAFGCVIFATVASFLFCHICLQLFFLLTERRPQSVFGLLFLCGFLFVIVFNILERDFWITLVCSLVYFSLIYVFNLSGSLKHISYVTFFYLLIAIFSYAVQGALCVQRFSNEDRLQSQFRFADEFISGRDNLGEFLLNDAVLKIKNDSFIQNGMTNPFFSKGSIRQKIRQVHLNNYFDRYDVGINLYNSVGSPLDAAPYVDFASQVKDYETKSKSTGYDGIYFVGNSQNLNDGKYIVVISLQRTATPVGFVVISLAVKKLIPHNVYPELLVDNRFSSYSKGRDFSYAVIANKKIISSFGDFNYERDFKFTNLGNEDIYKSGIISSEFVHVGIEDDDQKVVLVSARQYPLFYSIGNFSFWIVIGLFLVLGFLTLEGVYYSLKGQLINYSSRVQLYFYASVFIPLLIISITTLSITTRSAALQLSEEFINKAKLIGESITPQLIALKEDLTFSKEDFEREIIEIAKVSDIDATVFDASGKILASSQPLIFDYQFKSELIDQEALNRIVYGREVAFAKDDKIGMLNYKSAYCALRSPNSGQLIGIVTLPFFSSASSLEKAQITILTNILIIFMVVLIVSSFFTLFAAEQLTLPLRKIARSLGRTTFTGHNELLEWNSSDEIGVMVQEYNRMVQNLDQSKLDLARIQKESAWREMAKQVAHEIKNPLTPMKLSLQQMEHLLKSPHGLTRERIESSIKTMLTQIEILNEIASSFSTFARMPSPVLIKLELNSILEKTIDLYQNQSSGTVSFTSFADSAYVNGDEQLLTRIFSNIILNALQAGNGTDHLMVNVFLKKVNQLIEVSIEDNGIGISNDLKDKIFNPYFSTKKSGSGLGLAIVKQGVEQSGGNIKVISEEGKGTTFYVTFPAV